MVNNLARSVFMFPVKAFKQDQDIEERKGLERRNTVDEEDVGDVGLVL